MPANTAGASLYALWEWVKGRTGPQILASLARRFTELTVGQQRSALNRAEKARAFGEMAMDLAGDERVTFLNAPYLGSLGYQQFQFQVLVEYVTESGQVSFQKINLTVEGAYTRDEIEALARTAWKEQVQDSRYARPAQGERGDVIIEGVWRGRV